jgi:RNA polymerase sigma-70 factor (ECF subfamily)
VPSKSSAQVHCQVPPVALGIDAPHGEVGTVVVVVVVGAVVLVVDDDVGELVVVLVGAVVVVLGAVVVVVVVGRPGLPPLAASAGTAAASTAQAATARAATARRRLVRYLRARAPRDHADLASDTWLDVARNLQAFEGTEDDLTRWIFTVARHRLVDHWRRAQRRPVVPVPDGSLDPGIAPSAEADAFAGALAYEAVERILALLPPEQAEVVLLRVVAGLDGESVAAITGRRPGAVRVAQHRALKRLARQLGPRGNAEEERSGGPPRDAHAPSTPR